MQASPRARQETETVKLALTSVLSGLVVGGYGLTLFQQGGPCTLHLGFGGMGLMAVGAGVGIFGLVRVNSAINASNEPDERSR